MPVDRSILIGSFPGDPPPSDLTAAVNDAAGIADSVTAARSTGGWPDATNTGYTGTLTAYSGPTTISSASVTIENKVITGQITVTANNLTIRNCSFLGSGGYYCLLFNGGSGALIEDSKFSGGTTASIAVVSGQFVARRLNVSGGEDGVRMSSNSELHDSYIHDLVGDAGSHYDSVTADGYTGVKIIHNTILNSFSQTSCVWVGDPRYGPSEVLLQDNFLAGGGYTVYAGHGTGLGIRCTGNAFSTQYFSDCGSYSWLAAWNPSGNTWSGNYWADGPNVGTSVTA